MGKKDGPPDPVNNPNRDYDVDKAVDEWIASTADEGD